MRCHLGVVPQERTAEEHTTRGPRTTLATSGRGILGGTVFRDWSLSTVPCEGGMSPARTLTTSALQLRSSMSCSPVSMGGDVLDGAARCARCPMARCARCDVRWRAAVFVEPDETTAFVRLLRPHAFRRLLLQIGGANIAAARIALFIAAYFVVARRRKACPLARPQHCGARDPKKRPDPSARGFRRSLSTGSSHSRRGARCAERGVRRH